MNGHLVLVGGGHAHMVTLANLHKFREQGHEVTVIGPSEHHYYSGMGPGMLAKTYTANDIRFRTRHVVEKAGADFINAKVISVDPITKALQLDNGERVPYDVVSFNAGSFVPNAMMSGPNTDIFAVKPIEKLQAAQTRFLELATHSQIKVGIVGGGPSAGEIAGNIWGLARQERINMPEITLLAGRKFMSRFPAGIQRAARKILAKRGIIINESGYVREVKSRRVALTTGEIYEFDIIFMAVGVKPSEIFVDSGLPTGPDGGLLVNKYLQSVKYPEIFGGGDCIYFAPNPLDKVGVYAVRENPILFANLMAALNNTELTPFDPGGDYLLIFNMGANFGILKKKGLMFSGRLAFMIKDYIDRRFMRKFQAMEQ